MYVQNCGNISRSWLGVGLQLNLVISMKGQQGVEGRRGRGYEWTRGLTSSIHPKASLTAYLASRHQCLCVTQAACVVEATERQLLYVP